MSGPSMLAGGRRARALLLAALVGWTGGVPAADAQPPHRAVSPRRPVAVQPGNGGRTQTLPSAQWFGYRVPPAALPRGQRMAPAPRLPFYVARKGQTTIYVLGTLHAGEARDFPVEHPFRPAIQAALNRSALVAFELSPDDLISSEAVVRKAGFCPDACLSRLATPALYARVMSRLQGNRAAQQAVRRMRPWFAALMLETYDSMSSGLQTEFGAEAQIENAYLKGRVVGLETLREQVDAFATLDLPSQREMLAQNLAQKPTENAADLRRLHALWRAGDADALAAWQAAKTAKLTRDRTLAARIEDQTVYRRNRRFVVRALQRASPRDPIFVAVGVLHLGGPHGVLAMLRSFGYKVSPA
ncbi:TraB/GumN family protein [Chitinasiproducens palmae]|uniref:TraB/GumN family protein n=1 Tax=Chitinasiproducens palmae TaxID=1770053 RepID=A0A1H2PU60_9BURK|nr:TraB/GumN family protein [Chitinasiproducens palmae]SDV50323.1 hypothetical protein SAMN05216551_11196 [Chitinasiproducens palmae]